MRYKSFKDKKKMLVNKSKKISKMGEICFNKELNDTKIQKLLLTVPDVSQAEMLENQILKKIGKLAFSLHSPIHCNAEFFYKVLSCQPHKRHTEMNA